MWFMKKIDDNIFEIGAIVIITLLVFLLEKICNTRFAILVLPIFYASVAIRFGLRKMKEQKKDSKDKTKEDEKPKVCLLCGKDKNVKSHRVVSLKKYDLCDECLEKSYKTLISKSLVRYLITFLIPAIGILMQNQLALCVSIIIDLGLVIHFVFPKTSKKVEDSSNKYIMDMYFYSSLSGDSRDVNQAHITGGLYFIVKLVFILFLGMILIVPFISYHLIVVIYSFLSLMKLSDTKKFYLTILLSIILIALSVGGLLWILSLVD